MKERKIRIIKRLVLILLEVIMVFSLFGCAKKHKLNLDGYGFTSKKTEYKEGEEVTVYFDLIATDTDYRFWLDDSSVELKQSYDHTHGYIFTFTMPDHDITLEYEFHNSMEYDPGIVVIFENEVTEADIWILPQTEENLKTTLWGTATVYAIGAGESANVYLRDAAYTDTWMIRIIDTDHAYYAAQDISLEEGYTIIFRSDDFRYDAMIEVRDFNDKVIYETKAFIGVFGAE